MCGIVGIVKPKDQVVRPSEIDKMITPIIHRGPNASGRYNDNNVGFGHTRLSIIDLNSDSNQPFKSSDGRYVITYNGEIFNYIELRKKLKDQGVEFRTSCDTEVVLNAYICWGEDCVTQFNGMWAFAIYDVDSGQVFCSRDRFGIKPLVYAQHKNVFVFGSEAKSILALYPELAVPNYESLSYCLRQSISAGLVNTCFEGIKRLAPSHNLILTSDGIDQFRYWNYPKLVDKEVSKEEATKKILSILDDSVRLRMRSDVPIGITLSSGLDSTTVAHLMGAHTSESINCYTSTYGDNFSESETAEKTADALGFTFRSVACSYENFEDSLRQVIRHIETPHNSPAILSLWNIMSAASEDVTVVLEGQGADELFAGYMNVYFGNAALNELRRGRFLLFFRQLWAAFLNIKSHPAMGTHYFFSNMLRSIFPNSDAFIRKYGRGDESVYIGPLSAVNSFIPCFDPEFDDHLNQRLHQAHSVGLLNLLHYGDAISMAHGLESRLPFMDYRLVEYVFRLPGGFKLYDGVGKKILREAVDGLIPNDIRIDNNKLGFVTPISEWIREYPECNVYPILYTRRCEDRGLFDFARMKSIVDKHVSGKRDYGNLIFRWMSCEIWFQEFIDRNCEVESVAS